ncbi:hypothetical protein B0H13DRAFT_2079331 [Mycena leptocephala]|nr:hypothetical protein B0H13DRAFT_2079331 [Mycena leptocephala]
MAKHRAHGTAYSSSSPPSPRSSSGTLRLARPRPPPPMTWRPSRSPSTTSPPPRSSSTPHPPPPPHPTRSLTHDSSSPTSPSHSPATELDKQAAAADPSVNDDEDVTLVMEGTPVLTPETHEAPSLDDEEEPTPQTKEEETPYPHIFAIGDAADAFGALPAGHNAWAQGEVAGRNVLRLISRHGGDGIAGEGCEGKKREEDEELETYTPGPPAIKVSLGLQKTISQVNGAVGVTVSKEREGLNAAAMWGVFGCAVEDADGEEMLR